MERDHYQIIPPYVILYFNSHAHVERDFVILAQVVIVNNFNSHAHVERDIVYRFVWLFCIISTHTLTWSVTL